jgi:hypothetical protein
VCHPPSPPFNLSSSSWVCAKISCQPKLFWRGFVAPPKFSCFLLGFCITHHHLPCPSRFYLFLFSFQPPIKERRKMRSLPILPNS